ncbi:DUF3953 domain-containing protein [Fictibacillus sp. 26RED30]|uniref:DUF3953 domain-containing protein n=1 Tax=Fictibacillus sp. 26RED30 TaxID=2745877 RepID=UPI0018CDFC77|nr:DUF3953 domain-containing protein [Fictibacillus sp. 26RED30]MBH0161435.1 DUF3953 domain-containing protein [Fictibacillus sp. 26RED30]
MFGILKIAFSAVVLLLAVYGLSTGNHDLTPYTSLGVALLLLVIGFEEWQKKKKWISYLCFFAFAVNFYVSVQSFIV